MYLHVYVYIACDQLFKEASSIVAQSATDANKLLLLEQKLMLRNDDAKQQCLQVIFVCMYIYISTFSYNVLKYV